MRVLATGTTVAGYRIESLIGRGGMGVVYRARELGLERTVALKVISPALVGDGEIRERFLREARAAAAVEHPHVIPVHAAGDRGRRRVHRDAPRGRRGPARPRAARAGARHRERRRRWSSRPPRAWTRSTALGSCTATSSRPTSCSTAPATCTSADFGLVKHVLSQSGATRSGQWVGSLDYIAPEQIRGGRIDARADIYALGGVLYFALTGRVPFEHEGDEAKLWAQLSAPPRRRRRLRPGVSPSLDARGRAGDEQATRGALPVRGRSRPRARGRGGGTRADAARADGGARRGRSRGGAHRARARAGGDHGSAPRGRAPRRPVHAARRARPTRGRRTLGGRGRGARAARRGRGRDHAARRRPVGRTRRRRGRHARRRTPVARVSQTIEGVGDRPGLDRLRRRTSCGSPATASSTITRIDAGDRHGARPRPRVGRGVTSIERGRRHDLGRRRAGVAGRRLRRAYRQARPPAPARREAARGSSPRAPSGVWILMHRDNDGQRLRRYDRAGRRLRDKHNLGRRHSAMTRRRRVRLARRHRVARASSGSTRGRVAGAASSGSVARPTTLTYAGGHLWAVISAADTVVRLDQHNASERGGVRRGTAPDAGRARRRAAVRRQPRRISSVVVFDPRQHAPFGRRSTSRRTRRRSRPTGTRRGSPGSRRTPSPASCRADRCRCDDPGRDRRCRAGWSARRRARAGGRPAAARDARVPMRRRPRTRG